MIQRVYVDNYKCFVNTEVHLQPLSLLVGDNGSGKSALFEALSIVKGLVIGEEKVDNRLPASTLTRWQQRSVQTFEIYLEGNGGLYRYQLEVDHPRSERSKNKRRIQKEKLTFEGNPLFEFNLGEVQLYRDDFSEGPKYPFDWGRSALATIMPREENQRLTWFKDRLSRVYLLRIDPVSMSKESRTESTAPTSNLSNFVSWYRHLSQEDPQSLSSLFDDLEQVIDGFDVLKLSSNGGETRTMKVSITHQGGDGNGGTVDYEFDELSDGQRALVALYSLLRFSLHEDATLCIDEPENYLALAEIQPWLLELESVCGEHGSQAILISHHPELIGLFALENGTLFKRQNAGPTRTTSIDVEEIGRITVSDLMARGWHDE